MCWSVPTSLNILVGIKRWMIWTDCRLGGELPLRTWQEQEQEEATVVEGGEEAG